MIEEGKNIKNEDIKYVGNEVCKLEDSEFRYLDYNIKNKLEIKRNKENLLKAIEFLLEKTEITISSLQRGLKLGYTSVNNIINKMEDMKIISEYNGSAPRNLIVTREEWEEMKNTDRIRRIMEQ